MAIRAARRAVAGTEKPKEQHVGLPTPLFVHAVPPDHDWESAWASTYALLRGLRNEVHGRGAILAVVVIPPPRVAFLRISDGKPVGGRGNQHWDVEYPRRRIAEFLAREEIPHADATPAIRTFEIASKSSAFFAKDMHLNAAGHEVVGDVVADLVRPLLERGSVR